MKKNSHQNSYLDENGNCHWEIKHYSPNLLTAFFVILFCGGLFLFFYLREGRNRNLWFLNGVLLLYSLVATWDIYKYFFRSYIVEAVLYDEAIVLNYRKGESRTIPYTEIGFVDFQLQDGRTSRVRFYPRFIFYKKNSTSKILTSIYREEYVLFIGEVLTWEDYLRIKERLAEKEKHCFEPPETEECFKRSRLTRKARRDAGV